MTQLSLAFRSPQAITVGACVRSMQDRISEQEEAWKRMILWNHVAPDR